MIRLAHIRARLAHAYTTARDEIGVWLGSDAVMRRVMGEHPCEWSMHTHEPLNEEDR